MTGSGPRFLHASSPCTLLAAAIMVSSCTTFTHSIVLDRGGLERPVSASASFVGADGKVYGPAGYAKLAPFSIERKFETSMGKGKVQAFDLGAELNPIAKKAAADAIVGFKAYALTFDAPMYLPISIARNFGVASGFIGGLMYVAGQSLGDYDWGENSLKTIGRPFLIAGLAALGSSWGMELFATTSWTMRIEGTTVKISRR